MGLDFIRQMWKSSCRCLLQHACIFSPKFDDQGKLHPQRLPRSILRKRHLLTTPVSQNQNSQELDSIVQNQISTVKLGQNAFTVFHRNYDNTMYDILMSGGRWVDPPKR